MLIFQGVDTLTNQGPFFHCSLPVSPGTATFKRGDHILRQMGIFLNPYWIGWMSLSPCIWELYIYIMSIWKYLIGLNWVVYGNNGSLDWCPGTIEVVDLIFRFLPNFGGSHVNRSLEAQAPSLIFRREVSSALAADKQSWRETWNVPEESQQLCATLIEIGWNWKHVSTELNRIALQRTITYSTWGKGTSHSKVRGYARS